MSDLDEAFCYECEGRFGDDGIIRDVWYNDLCVDCARDEDEAFLDDCANDEDDDLFYYGANRP